VASHQAGRLDRAEALYRRILAARPRHADALHLLGLLHHQRGDQVEAETLIAAAIAVDACPAAYHNSLGVVYLACGRVDAARAALARALERDPVHPEALNNLGNALQAAGEPDAAVGAYDRALAARPGYAEALCNKGRALLALGRPAGADACFDAALELRPAYAKALRSRGDARAALGDRAGAEQAYRGAIAADPHDAETFAALAALLERMSRLDDAEAAAEQALTLDPGNVRAAIAAARCARRRGRAEAGLRRLAALPLAEAEPEARAYAAFETAMLCDALGDFGRAYAAFVEANALTLTTPKARRIDATVFPRLIERLARCFSTEWVAGWPPAPPPDRPEPVFLIGFPRSGTTLLDQILDAHPALTTMEERDPVDVVRTRCAGLPGGYPEGLATLTDVQIADLRRLYYARVTEHLGGVPRGRLVDKMPLNTIDVGLIHRLFPRAKLILALRHPCDVVLSGFMQPFEPNAAMIQFTDLEQTARFYAAVMGLWQHYATVLPLAAVSLRYEDLIADVEAETRRLLAFLDLSWDPAVLKYAERAKNRAIATPSYHQVVQPLYRQSIGRWRNYRFAFDAILPILAPFIKAWGYAGDL
jgi:tetratricopeptide (TPR) repeat protein